MTIWKVDVPSVKTDIAICNELVTSGGDWEKKNKLKVYNGVVCILTRDYKKASDLFLDSVATFSCSEFIDFRIFIFYTVLSSLVAQPRAILKAKVVHNPEILTVIREIPNLKTYLESFFRCDYKTFFQAFCEIAD
jgi:26S proteasome regulatory subunit N7